MELKWWLWAEIKKNKIKKNRPLFFKLPILTRKTSSSEPCKYFQLNFVKEMTTPSTLGMTFVCLFVFSFKYLSDEKNPANTLQ